MLIVSTLGLNWELEKLPTLCHYLTTHRGDISRSCGTPLEGPFQWYVVRVFHAELQVLSLSLSVEEGRSTFGIMEGILAKS